MYFNLLAPEILLDTAASFSSKSLFSEMMADIRCFSSANCCCSCRLKIPSWRLNIDSCYLGKPKTVYLMNL